MSFRKQIMLSFILSITVIFSILLFAVQYSVVKNNRNHTMEQTGTLIEAKASEMGIRFYNVVSQLRVLSELPSFRSINIRRIQPIIESLSQNTGLGSGSAMHLFGVGGLDGKSWVNAESTIQVMPREDFLRLIDDSSEYIISNPISTSNNTAMYMIYLPIFGYSEKKIGMLYGGIPAGRIINMLADISPHGGITWIMDGDNRIISHNNGYFYNHVISYEKLSESAAVIGSRESGIFETLNQSGEKATVFHSLIPYTDGWRLCTVIENRRIHSHTQSIMRTIILFWFILIIASAYLSIKLSRHIAVPLEKLTESMKGFEKGNLSPIELEGAKDDFYYLSQTYNSMTQKISELFDEILLEQKKARESELRALQSQINPHFLYNTLDTMKWMAMDYGADDIQEMLGSLSSFFRLSLSDGKEIIPLSHEIDHARHYLKVQHIRYSDIMDYEIDIDDELKDIPCTKLIIQPLVENAIYHGIKPKGSPGQIRIHAGRRDKRVFITVSDTGVGMSAEKLEEIRMLMDSVVPSDHYGIFNIAERLRIRYGGKASITVDSEPGRGTTACISFPVEGEAE